MFSKPFKSALILACLMLAGCSMFSSRGVKPGERVVFFGDSITFFGDRPGGYVTLVRDGLARDGVEVIGAGIPAHKVGDLMERVDKDVIAKKPSVVVIYIGINDVWHWRRNQGTTQDVFEADLNALTDKIQAAGGRVILVTPTVIGEKKNGANKWDPWLDEFAGITRKVAQDRGLVLVDLRAMFKDYIRTHNPNDLDKGILTEDTVHLNPTGNKLVAQQMLKALSK